MADNNYYTTLTAPFRTVEVGKYVTFSPDGISFSYNTPGIAFHLSKSSKNRYEIKAIYAGKYEMHTFSSQRDAVAFALKLLEYDRAGLFRARKSS